MDGGDVSAVLGHRSTGAGHRVSGPDPPGAVHRHQRAHRTPQVLVLLHVAPHGDDGVRRRCNLSPGTRTTLGSLTSCPVSLCLLGPETPDPIEVEGSNREAKQPVIFTWPNTWKNPRPRSTNAPFRAGFADSMTWRRPVEIRHAVVPPGCAGKEPDQRGHGENPFAAPAPRGRVGSPEGPGRPNIKERS